MKLRKLNTSDMFLIIANLIPVYGVLFEGWNAAQIFLVFCLETVIIGLFNVLKMACVTLFVKSKDIWSTKGRVMVAGGFFFIIFFIVHYGFFVLVQTHIFFGVSGIIKDNSLFGAYKYIPQALGDEGRLLLLIFIVYYTLHTLYSFFLSGEYKTISLGKLMLQPYGRIFIQQLVVIVGSMFLGLGLNFIFILILVVVKMGFELFFNFDSFLNKAEAEQKLKTEKLKNAD